MGGIFGGGIMIFWEPFNKARMYGDFRDLIKAIESDDPMAFHPEVVKLLAEQVKNPRSPSRRTSLRESIIWARRIRHEMSVDTGPKRGRVVRAKNAVLDRHPEKNMDALNDHWKDFLAAGREVEKMNIADGWPAAGREPRDRSGR
jgi:hypothetical protein